MNIDYYICIYFIFLLLNVVGLLYVLHTASTLWKHDFLDTVINFCEYLFYKRMSKSEVITVWTVWLFILVPLGFVGFGIFLSEMFKLYEKDLRDLMVRELEK